MTEINKDEVMNIADIAKLALTDEEAEDMTEHLHNFMKFVDKLNELNTDDVLPTTHIFPEQTAILRKDEAKQSITQEEALKNAPEHKDGHFKVPAILE